LRVKRNFDLVYQTQNDPWNIGNADSDRYNLYYQLVLKYSKSKGRLLDIGCGFGAFLARFKNDYDRLMGLEISRGAIIEGKKRFPFITFYEGSAENLEIVFGDTDKFDTILYSDVICYFSEKGKNRSLEWIASHIETEGMVFIAAWCPGHKYLTHDELQRLVKRYFKIVYNTRLDSEHSIFICQKKRKFIAFTIDYETWQPIPENKKIDWQEDVIRPSENILNVAGEKGIPLTLMVEMGEYFYLCQHEPVIAKQMEHQWMQAIQEGHDIQLHLHPSWLPELGARCEHGEWKWDFSKSKANDYPGDLSALIHRCKSALEGVIKKVEPSYQVSSFRAGAYQVQPFKRLYDALRANQIYCDSSVFAGGVSRERGYNYAMAYSNHQPYFANAYDPQLKAPPSEQSLIEIPIFTWDDGKRWCLDETETKRFAERMLNYLKEEFQSFQTNEARRRSLWLKGRIAQFYQIFSLICPSLNRILPKSFAHWITLYESETLAGHDYYVITGHTKGYHDFDAIKRNCRALKKNGRFEYLTLSQMAKEARRELLENSRPNAREEACYQVRREYNVVMGEARNHAQSHYLQRKVPLDRKRILDLGCGTGHWAGRISKLYPWMTVAGMDYGIDFLMKAKESFHSQRGVFIAGDFMNLPFHGERFDCVYADNSLEHAFDIDRTLSEIFRVLRWGGVLVAAIPADARNTRKICDNHVWKTASHEVAMRFEHAGFSQIEIEEVDVFRKLGMAPFPPSDDRMIYARAWKRKNETLMEDRVLEIMEWVYQNLSPEKSQESNNPVEILSRGYAFCWGYAVVLGKILEQEGFDVKWVTMLAKGHQKGRGKKKVDSHEVVLLQIDGKEKILDPMTNTVIPYPLADVLSHPELAVEKKEQDSRYKERGYYLYDTSYWYSRVFRYAIRSKTDAWFVHWRKKRAKA
jgi:ubiquinone/menaquinone biosynthesis C-methylase UbiE